MTWRIWRLRAATMVGLAFAAGCGRAAVPPQGEDLVSITETTQATVDGVSVGAGNIWHGAYALPDGTQREGISAHLYIGGGPPVRVGQDSVVTIGGRRWRVVAVEEGARLGEVRLQPLAGEP